jgi:hypothetical protein
MMMTISLQPVVDFIKAGPRPHELMGHYISTVSRMRGLLVYICDRLIDWML